jgi:hypothetical protein
MRHYLLLSVLVVALASVGASGDVAQPSASKVDTAVLEKRIAELERQLASLQKELQALRSELQVQAKPKVVAMTPEEAVASFKLDPKKPITVEFGVESAGWPDGPVAIDEDQMPPLMADWDNRLKNGGKFTLILTAKAIRGLKDVGIELPSAQPAELVDLQRLGVLCRHLKGAGVRVTGSVRANRPDERYTDYYIVVDDPANFTINK